MELAGIDDKNSSRYKELENAWNAFHEKREVAYFNWNQYVKLDFKPDIHDLIFRDETYMEKKAAFQAYVYGFLMNLHAAYDSIPFLLNKVYQLGIPEKRVSWNDSFIENAKLKIPNLEEIMSNKWFYILKGIVNRWKHRDQTLISISSCEGAKFLELKYEFNNEILMDDFDVNLLMKTVHNELDPLIFKLLN